MKRILTVLLFLSSPVFADPAAVAKQVRTWRTNHELEILAEFADLLSIPNLANDAPNIQRNAEAIRAMCEKRGLTTKLLTIEGAPPVVVANLSVPEAKRTIAFYAHYDGQPVDASQWKSPPWQPVMRDQAGKDVDWRAAKSIDPEWRFFARSSADDKAPIMAMLAALDALKAANVKPSVNLRFVFEGEEEAGSPHLADYLKRFRAELQRRRLAFLRWSRSSKPPDGTRLRGPRHDRPRADRLWPDQRFARRPLRQLGAKPHCSPDPS